MTAELVFIALLVHLLYDFHWQGEYVRIGKEKSVGLLFVHALTWGMLMTSVLYLFGIYAVWKIAFLIATHFVIDWITVQKRLIPRWLDQALHLVTIALVLY